MRAGKLQEGDLVTVEPWDCEGIEMPWGWRRGGEPENLGPTRNVLRTRLRPGTVGMIVRFDHGGLGKEDSFYTVLIGDQKLAIPIRFLNRIDQ
jgi:hypothetical protein